MGLMFKWFSLLLSPHSKVVLLAMQHSKHIHQREGWCLVFFVLFFLKKGFKFSTARSLFILNEYFKCHGSVLKGTNTFGAVKMYYFLLKLFYLPKSCLLLNDFSKVVTWKRCLFSSKVVYLFVYSFPYYFWRIYQKELTQFVFDYISTVGRLRQVVLFSSSIS